MKVAVNACSLRGRGSGLIGRMVLENWAKAESTLSVFAWVPREWRDHYDIRFPSEWKWTEVPSGMGAKAQTELVTIPQTIHRAQVQVLFSMGDTGTPFPGVPHLLLVQQAFLAYPESELDFPMSESFQLRLKMLSLYFRLGIRGVERITVQSLAMRRRLTARWGIPEDKVTVVPSAPSDEWGNVMRLLPSGGAEYIVYLTTHAPYKNHRILPSVLHCLRQGGLPIRCALTVMPDEVPELVEDAKRLRVLEDFTFHGRLTQQAAMRLVAGAAVHVIPSKLESFGLAYYESMAAGCPMVVSDREFSREACGDAALYADADNPREFADMISKVLSSHKCRDELSRKSRRRYETICRPWNSIASDYLRILSEIAA